MKYILRNIVGLEVYKLLRFLRRRIMSQNVFYLQKSPTRYKRDLIYLGSIEGGKTIYNSINLKNSIILSAGLGEDASFDVEFANKFNAKVLVFDPTPRAIIHFEKVLARSGQKRTTRYTSGGCQPAESYDLRNVEPNQLCLIKKALWIEETNLKFFAPPKSSHVSHSISNFQNDYRIDTPSIEVQSTTIELILKQENINKLELLKLDIEGAEIEVLEDLMDKRIFPNQIIVEYDELNIEMSNLALERIERTHKILTENSYELIHSDGQADFLYILNKAIK